MIPEVKNTLNGINSSLDTHEEKINKLEDKTTETVYNMKQDGINTIFIYNCQFCVSI